MKLVSILTSPQGSLVLLFVFLLLGGLFSYYGTNPRILYFPLIGVVVLVLYLGHIYIQDEIAAKERKETTAQNQPQETKPSNVIPQEKREPPHTPEPVEEKAIQPTTASEQTKRSTPDRGKTKMSDKKPDKNIEKSVTQSMINSPGGIQAGRDVNIHQAPQPRRLTLEQRNRVIAILKQAPKSKATISFAINSKEALSFAQQITEVLASAGWNATLGSPTIEATPVDGIGIFVRSKDDLAAGALQHALTEAGFPAEGFVNPELPEEYVGIFVAPKP